MARSRPTTLENPRILIARLDGTAHRLVREKAEADTCIAELHAITTDPAILGQAAGVALGAWRANQRHDADRVARMLTAAGADLAVRDEVAAETKARLARDGGRPGIGMRTRPDLDVSGAAESH